MKIHLFNVLHSVIYQLGISSHQLERKKDTLTSFKRKQNFTHDRRVLLEFFNLILSFHFFFLLPVCLSHLEGPIIRPPPHSTHLQRTLQFRVVIRKYTAAEQELLQQGTLFYSLMQLWMILCLFSIANHTDRIWNFHFSTHSTDTNKLNVNKFKVQLKIVIEQAKIPHSLKCLLISPIMLCHILNAMTFLAIRTVIFSTVSQVLEPK